VGQAQDWRWSSAASDRGATPVVDASPVPLPAKWLEIVNQTQTEAEVESLHESLRRDRPFGHSAWTAATAERLGLEQGLRPGGRPRKAKPHSAETVQRRDGRGIKVRCPFFLLEVGESPDARHAFRHSAIRISLATRNLKP